MLPFHVEMLLGHDTGLSMNYYRPSLQTLLQDYEKAVYVLTVNGDKAQIDRTIKTRNPPSKR